MKCFGSSTSFLSVVCTYGYSFAIYIPVVIPCSLNIGDIKWILLGYACFSSTSLLLVNYWKELSKYMENRRYIILAFVIVCNVGLLFFIKLYFFVQFENTIKLEDLLPKNSTVPTNSSIKNSTLLFYY